MTISTTTSSVILNANGSTHEFTFNFKILAATDLTVIVRSTSGSETVKTLNSHYIVPTTSVGAANGGTILFKFNTGDAGNDHYSSADNRPANGEKVIIRRSPALDQSLDLVDNDPFSAELIETSLDKITMQVQSLQEEVDRSFRLSRTNLLDKDGSQIDNAFFQLSDDVATRKGKYLQFNSTTGVIEPSATSDDVTTLAAVTTDIALLADIQDGTSATNTLTVVSGISGNVTTCASISSNITTVAGISSNVTTVAGKASLITSDFATDMALIDSTFVTKMGLVTSDFVTDMSLVTADFISDLNTLGSSSIVDDLNILATSDIVTDMNLLATSANVTAMGNLGTSTNVTNMANLNASGVITNIANLNASGVIANIGTAAGSISNINTVAAADSNISALNASGVIANIATVAAADSNISTVASNISGVNSFGERYRVGSSDPTSSLDEGDLFYNSTSNALKYYNGSSFQAITPVTTGISSGNVPVFTSGAEDDDFLRIAGTSIEGRSASQVLSDIGGQASLTFGISDTNAVKIDSSSVADDEYARFTANGLESRSTSEVLSDIGGQASLTFGISNTNAVKIDSASVADDEYARFTSNGLESRSTSEVLSDIGGAALAGATFTGEITANGGINEDHNNGALSNSNQTLTLDCHDGNNFSVTLAANITSFSVTNLPASGTAFFFTLKVTQDSSARSITWGSAVKWNAATAPTLTATSGGVDIFAFYTIDSGTTIYGFTTGQGLA